MNKIEKLIKELCPNGVEWKKLIDVANVLYGFPCDSNMFTEDSQYIPLIRIRDVLSGTASSYTTEYISDEYIIKKGDILVGMDGNFNLAKWNDRDGYLNQRVCKIETKDSEMTQNNYLFHYLKPLFKQIELETAGGSVIHLSAKKINSIHIPLPPLPIQTEIVRILDKFVEQQEQLERLIELRKKQYEYYREEMLKPKEGEVEIPFSDCCTLVTKQTGFDYSSKIKPALKKQYEEGCIPFLQTRNFTNNVFDYNTEYYVPEEIVKQFPKIVLDEKCLLFSIVGASIGNVGLFPGDKKCFLGGAICVAKIKKDYDVSYLYYFMASSQGQLQIMQKTKGAGQATITIEDIRNFTVRIPSKEKMSSIVNALVALENSINALTSALEASKKRYEYYRDEMMRF